MCVCVITFVLIIIFSIEVPCFTKLNSNEGDQTNLFELQSCVKKLNNNFKKRTPTAIL